MFEFYKKFITEEHYLTHNEIASLWSVFTLTGNPHKRLASAILKKYISDNHIEEVFYPSRHGMINVYSRSVYLPAYKDLLNLMDQCKEGSVVIDGKTHNYRRERV